MKVDWAAEWKQHRDSSPWVQKLKEKGISSEDFWDSYKYADSSEEYDSLSGYPGLVLVKMLRYLNENSSVLDIGAGAGAYTIPLAKVARSVTVVEPSKGQIARLQKRARKNGLENIQIINNRWQDVESSDLERYDLVNAAYCFHIPEIVPALQKMLDVTTGALSLVTLADHGFKDVYEVIFQEHEGEPEYIYLYNALLQMGYPSDVEIIHRRYQLPLEKQIGILKSSYDFTPGLEERLLAHLAATKRLVKRESGQWVQRNYKDAMIWYRKSGQ
ncbi:MAG: 16S rRNA methyltransferase GidB [Methanosaeta sp. PtaU1.Bin060]|nr:MAG: 16S rRNA methyltransferase GidB [Methanosaeta sp. PtaU1.Bin060]